MSSYARALNDLLIKKNLEVREANGFWFPSQLGGCDRAAFLAHSGTIPNPKTPAELRNLWLGDQIHKALQANVPFELLGSEKTARCRSDEFKLSGRLDALVRNSDDEVEVVEFKSVLEKKYNYPLPMEDHVWQVGCYLTFPIWHLDPDIARDMTIPVEVRYSPHTTEACNLNEHDEPIGKLCEHYIQHPQPEVARIVYWAKENADMREFFVYPSVELEKKVKGELTRLEETYQAYLISKQLPEPLPADNWRFKNRANKVYCDFVGKGCCNDERQRVDIAPVRAVRRVVSKKSPS